MNTKTKIITRLLMGFPLGIFISYTISVLISVIFGRGYFSAVVPTLAETYGSEIAAVCVQYFASGLLGAACAVSSVVFETESWSVLKQTIVHFVIIFSGTLATSLLMGWIPLHIISIVIFAAIFIVIYIILWFILTTISKKQVQEINSKLK